MPRFFFHLYDDIETVDHEGLELPHLEAAALGAVQSARALMCDTLMRGHLDLSHRIDIEDEQGQVLKSVHFADVVRVEPLLGPSKA